MKGNRIVKSVSFPEISTYKYIKSAQLEVVNKNNMIALPLMEMEIGHVMGGYFNGNFIVLAIIQLFMVTFLEEINRCNCFRLR